MFLLSPIIKKLLDGGWGKIFNVRMETNDGSQRRPLIYIIIRQLEPVATANGCAGYSWTGWFTARKSDMVNG
ncbi:MAG TPA: hypothetical protein VFO54_03735 [Chryseosolibacter sp.]|nr:hypothetical protein [Chryseosolibacter sp.]